MKGEDRYPFGGLGPSSEPTAAELAAQHAETLAAGLPLNQPLGRIAIEVSAAPIEPDEPPAPEGEWRGGILMGVASCISLKPKPDRYYRP